MDIKIQDLIPEGTEVKEGDYIGALDRTTFDNSLKDELERLETMNTAYQMLLLDSAVTLSNLRDGIKNQNFSVEEAAITLDQSKYEPLSPGPVWKWKVLPCFFLRNHELCASQAGPSAKLWHARLRHRSHCVPREPEAGSFHRKSPSARLASSEK